jgi:hypothetical protein
MKHLALVVTTLALTAAAVGAQEEKNLPNALITTEAGGVQVRYLNFKWNPEAFEALEQGGGAPAGTRSWALGRILTPHPITVDGHPVSGGAILILNPATDMDPMTLEIRMVDMRDIFQDMNVIAEPPEGTTAYKVPAEFETVQDVADRLTMKLAEEKDALKLSIHYGNRLLVLEAEED